MGIQPSIDLPARPAGPASRPRLQPHRDGAEAHCARSKRLIKGAQHSAGLLSSRLLPRLCAVVPASELRQSFRNKLVHAFGIAHPYALGWKENAYVHQATLLSQKWKVIDVYEMTNEFLAYLRTPAALAEQKRRQKP